jgi:phage N-6-adenine-methyltransferase
MTNRPLSLSKTGGFRYQSDDNEITKSDNKIKRPVGRPRKHRTAYDRLKAYRQRKKRSVHFHSDTDQWSTPDDLFDDLDVVFHFTIDVCADATNAKCQTYFTKEMDGLKQRWDGICWCNPPYGRDIIRWVQKAFEASLYGACVVCLLPARVDTRWWHEYVTAATDIRFIKGRLKFGSQRNSAPFPSAIVVFRGGARAHERRRSREPAQETFCVQPAPCEIKPSINER